MKDGLKILACIWILIRTFIACPDSQVKGQVMVPRPEDLYQEAEEYMLAEDFQEALSLYMELYRKGYATSNISYKIGTCYLNLPGMKTNAIPFLKDATAQVSASYKGESLDEPYAPVKSFLYLGIAYRVHYEFAEAERAFLMYLSSLDKEDEVNLKMVQEHLARIRNARELIAAPAGVRTDTLPGTLNNASSNFNALVTQDEKILYYNEQLKFYDAVMQSEIEDGSWQKPENITSVIRSDGDHLLTGISADGSMLLLSAYDPYMSGEIYVATLENGKWGTMKALNEYINTQFNESHASFSDNDRTLYFTSDRPGGYGGLDIYRTERDESGEWGPAQNLGPVVNTAYNEETPFVASLSGTLFFSSQGHYNMGGYDIFSSERTGQGDWQHPVNLGYPVNGPDDDLFYFVLPGGNAGYKSVFTDGSSDLNMVRIEVISPAHPLRYNLSGRFNVSDEPGYPSRDLNVSIIDIVDDDTLMAQALDEKGSFTQPVASGSYRVEVMNENGTVYAREVEIPDYFPHRDILLNADIRVPFAGSADTILVRDLRFDFDKSELVDDAGEMLDNLAVKLTLYPEMTVTLNGYADALGSDAYNRTLSLARANTAKEYLLERNIAPARITVHGFGEEDPVAINNLPDGTDSPEGRSYNRRVEIRVALVPDSLTVIPQASIPDDLKIR